MGQHFGLDTTVLRYFNTYGPGQTPTPYVGVITIFINRLLRGEAPVIYGDGEQRRDFVSVEDCVNINLFFLDHPGRSGIFNAGTGNAQSFNDVAVATVNTCRKAKGEPPLTLAAMRERAIVQYIPFPEDLKGRYQSYTQADMSELRAAGYGAPFLTVEQGVTRYCQKLLQKAGA